MLAPTKSFTLLLLHLEERANVHNTYIGEGQGGEGGRVKTLISTSSPNQPMDRNQRP